MCPMSNDAPDRALQLRPEVQELVDDALAKVMELGTVGAMKWLALQLQQPVAGRCRT